MSYGTSKELAQRACVWLNAHPARNDTRPTTRYVVEAYPTPFGQYAKDPVAGINCRHDYGVVRKWKYADRPDLGEFGGAFVDLNAEMWA